MFKYKLVYKNGKMVPEHRMIMEELIGRSLESGEIVHHINGNPLDNSLDNLKLLPDQASHRKEHIIYGTPKHMVRLYIEDEEKLKATHGKVTSSILRDIVHEQFIKMKSD